MQHFNEDGNNCVRAKNFRGALDKYKAALKSAHSDMFTGSELMESYKGIRIKIINNIAFCCLKVGDFVNASAAC
jgi:hypothetical protein